MRAVTGRILSTRPISLARAANTLSRFAPTVTACPEVAAYLRRASNAFDELVSVHRHLRSSPRKVQSPGFDEDLMRSKKRKLGDVGGGGGDFLVAGEERKDFANGKQVVDLDEKKSMKVALDGDDEQGVDGKKRRKKKNMDNDNKDEKEGVDRKEEKEKSKKAVIKDGDRKSFDNEEEEKGALNGLRLVNGMMSEDDGVIWSDEGRKRRKKKKKFDKENNRLVEVVSDEKIVVIREEEERHQEEEKKKKKIKEKKTIVENKENSIDTRHKEDFAGEEGRVGADDRSEHHRKKKKIRKDKPED